MSRDWPVFGRAFPTFGTDEWWELRVDATGDCWLANGYLKKGYARVWVDGHRTGAHRAVWELLVGPIPESMTLDHMCRVRNCVNPDHLRVMTAVDNAQSSPAYWATRPKKDWSAPACRHGHEWTEGNTYLAKDGGRRCRACHRDSSRQAYRKARGIADGY